VARNLIEIILNQLIFTENSFQTVEILIMKSDVRIQQDVIDQLAWEPIFKAVEVDVFVKKRIVTLSGIVDTYANKVAENAAKKVAGVKPVAEDIQVGLSPGFQKTDSEVAEAVLNALKWKCLYP
jgi:hypothetical protein